MRPGEAARTLRAHLAVAGAVLAVALLSSACGDEGAPSRSGSGSDAGSGASPTPAATTPSSTPAPTPASSLPDTGSAAVPPADGPTEPVVEVLAGDVRLEVTLFDNAAARSLLDQLPVTVRMSDHGGVEKTGRLPRALSTEGLPDGADPEVGELGYYSPGPDLVLYHGDQGYHPGIVRLGTMSGDLDALAGIDGDVEVRVRRLDRAAGD